MQGPGFSNTNQVIMTPIARSQVSFREWPVAVGGRDTTPELMPIKYTVLVFVGGTFSRNRVAVRSKRTLQAI